MMSDLVERLHMQPHPEGGYFVEHHPDFNGEGRAPSGAILYYLGPGDCSSYHRIDCDEHWCHLEGGSLELWVVSPEGELSIVKLGMGEGEYPIVCVPRGSIFAARPVDTGEQGVLVGCVTVPRFAYEGFQLVDSEELAELCPQAMDFYPVT